jgi:hypothetical protein
VNGATPELAGPIDKVLPPGGYPGIVALQTYSLSGAGERNLQPVV